MKPQRPLRIFIGVDDIGDYALTLAKGLRAIGVVVTTVVLERTKPAWRDYNRQYDRVLPHPNLAIGAAQLGREAIRSLFRYDVYVFVAGRTFTSDLLSYPWLAPLAYADLALLRRLGKVTVVTAHGSEIRSAPLYMRQLAELGFQHTAYHRFDEDSLRDDLKRARVRKVSRHADVIFAQPQYAHLLDRSFEFLWLPLDLSSLQFTLPDESDPPLILHAPTSQRHKGTSFVLEAVQQLQNADCSFRFELCENLSNAEVRRKLRDAAVVVDQFEPGGVGLFGLEAMASGCAVVGGTVPGFVFPSEIPVVSTTPASLQPTLLRLVQNLPLRRDLARRGRAYVETYHDHVSVAGKFLRSIGSSPGPPAAVQNG